jgi:hypothetical protein
MSKTQSIQIKLRDGTNQLCTLDETTTLSQLRSQIKNLKSEEVLVTDEGVCLDKKCANLDGVVNEVLKGKTPLIYVIRDDQSSQWIRYEVRPHDTIRLIALKFRVSCKTVKKFNPGLFGLSGNSHRLYKKYAFLPTSKVGPQYRDRECMTVSRDNDVPNGLECVALTRAPKEDAKIAKNKRVDIFKVVSGSNHKVAKTYLSTNKNDLRTALKAEKKDSEWEKSIRKRLSSSSSSKTKKDGKVVDLKTGLVRPPGDDPWERWQKHNATRFVKENPHGRWDVGRSNSSSCDSSCVLM